MYPYRGALCFSGVGRVRSSANVLWNWHGGRGSRNFSPCIPLRQQFQNCRVESPCVYKMPTLASSMQFLGTEL